MSLTTVVLGASPKEERYSNQAVRLLAQHNHKVIPVNPKVEEIAGIPVVRSLEKIDQAVDTVSIYLRPERLQPLLPALKSLAPRRVIFSPGTEDQEIEAGLRAAGIEAIEACTLVLLRTGQFE